MEGNLGADELQNREGLYGQDLVPPSSIIILKGLK